MEVYEESIVVHQSDDMKTHNEQPEEVVIILPDESCFEYEGAKKPRPEATKVTWTKEQTYMLITEYRLNKNELENPTNTKSVVWDRVSDKINEKFHANFNGDMCANKWRSLKNTYKRVRFSQRSEASKKRWEYYEALNEVYKGIRLEKPVTASKIIGTYAGEPNQAVHIVQFTPQGGSSSPNYDPLRLSPDHTQYETDTDPPQWFREFMQEYRRSEDLKMKFFHQMHRDLVRLGEKQCNLLEKIAEFKN